MDQHSCYQQADQLTAVTSWLTFVTLGTHYVPSIHSTQPLLMLYPKDGWTFLQQLWAFTHYPKTFELLLHVLLLAQLSHSDNVTLTARPTSASPLYPNQNTDQSYTIHNSHCLSKSVDSFCLPLRLSILDSNTAKLRNAVPPYRLQWGKASQDCLARGTEQMQKKINQINTAALQEKHYHVERQPRSRC